MKKFKKGIIYTTNLKTNKTKKQTFKIEIIELNQKQAEKIFKINLENRIYSIDKYQNKVEITFFDKDNVFGWLERLTTKEFNKRLKTC